MKPFLNAIILGFSLIMGNNLFGQAEERIADSAIMRELFNAVNDLRSKGCKCGNDNMPPVPPLKWNATMEKIALEHTIYLDSSNTFSHTGRNNSSVASRLTDAGYVWGSVAENIAKGQQNVTDVMKTWINSPGHCRNMMSATATEMGAAKVRLYWTQVFGKPL